MSAAVATAAAIAAAAPDGHICPCSLSLHLPGSLLGDQLKCQLQPWKLHRLAAQVGVLQIQHGALGTLLQSTRSDAL